MGLLSRVCVLKRYKWIATVSTIVIGKRGEDKVHHYIIHIQFIHEQIYSINLINMIKRAKTNKKW